MGRQSRLCGPLPAVVVLLGGSGGWVACSQAPAFTEEAVIDLQQRKDAVSGDSMGAAPCLALASNRSECVGGSGISSVSSRAAKAVSGQPEVQVGGKPGVGSPTEDPSPVVITPDPVPTPVVVVTPAPVPTPIPMPGALREQLVQEPDRGKLDILWVIDNSGSMAWAQKELGNKFASFASELQKADVDFRLAVTTTDVCRSDKAVDEFCPETRVMGDDPLRGNLVQPKGTANRFLTNSSSDLLSSFRSLALRGTSGSPLEQGLSAAKFAVEKSSQAGSNLGFLRADAPLAVMVLSDEEDDGVGMWNENGYGESFSDFFGNKSYALQPSFASRFNFANQKMTVARFREAMDVLKGKGRYQVNAITGVKASSGQTYCYLDSSGSPFGPVEAGTNYIRAAQETGGLVENICGNWTSILTNLGRGAVELTTRIQLDVEPFPGTLEVFVGGSLWSSGYEYDAASRTVAFKTLPPYGAQVLVRYREIVR
jgi:hypothetical protein